MAFLGANRGHRLIAAVAILAVALFVVVFLLVDVALTSAGQRDVQDQTTVGAASAARAIGGMLQFGHDLALTVTNEDGFGDVMQRTATPATSVAVRRAICTVIGSNPAILADYVFDRHGRYITGQDKAHCDRGRSVPSGELPSAWRALHGSLYRTLQMTTQMAMPNWMLSFGPGDGPYGSLYHFHPVTLKEYGGRELGMLVERVDAGSLFSPYVSSGSVGNLILAGNIVIGPQFAAYRARGELPVTAIDPALDPSIIGDSQQVPVGLTLDGDHPSFTQSGTDEVGSKAPIAMSNLRILNYTAASTVSGSATGTILAISLIVALAIGAVLLLVLYLNRQLRQGERESARLIETRSQALTEDIVAVSQALGVVREGDLTVQVPAVESEVGLLSLSLNGLINDYSQIVGGIVSASRAVQEGAARVDEGVQRIVTVATGQTASVAAVAAGVEAMAASAVEVQQATDTATRLAASARRAVESGQESVGRIADAVDAIKEAAIGTTREFKRLQEDSIRLTALVAAVKSNAENLDMQAANATLEARHLGTESGSAFATNIGRLARQAQDTLSDADGAVRSVVASIDEVNRRIERIAEQVRRGVEEVHSVRATFYEVTATNNSLVGFIDSVAESAGEQAKAAQDAAHSIGEISQVFEQFTELLISSSDEIAAMRLIVAHLRESVSDLKVSQDVPLALSEVSAA